MKSNIKAKALMYQLVKEQDLLEPIKKICKEAIQMGSKQWTYSGLLRELGKEIKAKESKKK